MTEVFDKRNIIFLMTCLLVAILINRNEAKKQVRNELVKKAHNLVQFQQRSAFCLHTDSGRGLDDTAVLRFHKETQKCYRIGERGPCGEMMVFTIADANHGVCDCDLSLRCGRPLIYYKNRCYFAYDQGPCREGKWLVFGFDLQPVCRRNPCLGKELQVPSYDSKYWFSYKGQCYRTYTKGYCHYDDEILFNARTHYRPTCMKNPDCSSTPHRGSVQSLGCLPGQRLDYLEKSATGRRSHDTRNTTIQLVSTACTDRYTVKRRRCNSFEFFDSKLNELFPVQPNLHFENRLL